MVTAVDTVMLLAVKTTAELDIERLKAIVAEFGSGLLV